MKGADLTPAERTALYNAGKAWAADQWDAGERGGTWSHEDEYGQTGIACRELGSVRWLALSERGRSRAAEWVMDGAIDETWTRERDEKAHRV